ncbi:MAG: hypothetical protein RRB13_02000 [bacterium]|nr:hypothetical protein [bacterium]
MKLAGWILLSVLLVGCQLGEDSPAVASCKKMCESNPALTQLDSKVVFKPVKLCQKRCAETEGTCSDQDGPTNFQACIFFGMNAGRAPGDQGPLLNFKR